jgi:hypothetical protein
MQPACTDASAFIQIPADSERLAAAPIAVVGACRSSVMPRLPDLWEGAGRCGGCSVAIGWRQWDGEGSLCSGRSYRRPGVVGDPLVRAAD